jgi:hypothetical protein
MSDRQLVQPQLRTAPTDPGHGTIPVPGDFLTDTVRRLRVACVVWMVLWAIGRRPDAQPARRSWRAGSLP